MTIHFVVHDEGDSVGVVVVEGLKAGQPLTGWIMDQDKMIEFTAKNDIPIGHKVAIKAIAKGVRRPTSWPRSRPRGARRPRGSTGDPRARRRPPRCSRTSSCSASSRATA